MMRFLRWLWSGFEGVDVPDPSAECLFRRLGVHTRNSEFVIERMARRLRRSGLSRSDLRRIEEAYYVLSTPVRREIYMQVRRGLAKAGLFRAPQ